MEKIKILKVSDAEKYKINPFLSDDVINIEKGKKSVSVGSTDKVLVDAKTGQTEAITIMHKYKEVDKDQFVKLFVGEIQALFDLSRTGLKVLGYVLTCLKVNKDSIYISIEELAEYCNYKHRKQVYKGLAELLANKIIAQTTKPNIWFINPTIVFNGNRIAFIKEYRLKEGQTLRGGEQQEIKYI